MLAGAVGDAVWCTTRPTGTCGRPGPVGAGSPSWARVTTGTTRASAGVGVGDGAGRGDGLGVVSVVGSGEGADDGAGLLCGDGVEGGVGDVEGPGEGEGGGDGGGGGLDAAALGELAGDGLRSSAVAAIVPGGSGEELGARSTPAQAPAVAVASRPRRRRRVRWVMAPANPSGGAGARRAS